jgi:hypothetical protein
MKAESQALDVLDGCLDSFLKLLFEVRISLASTGLPGMRVAFAGKLQPFAHLQM